MNAVETQARQIYSAMEADGTAPVGLTPDVIIGIILFLIPRLIKCFMPDNPEQVRQYVTKRHDPSTGYKRSLWRSTARQAKHAAADKGVQITWDDATAIAIATLDQARTGDDAALGAVFAEAGL